MARWLRCRAQVELDHLSTLWGKRVVGVLGGEGRGTSLITTLDLHGQGRFPFDELVTHFPFERIGAAMEAAEAGGGDQTGAADAIARRAIRELA